MPREIRTTFQVIVLASVQNKVREEAKRMGATLGSTAETILIKGMRYDALKAENARLKCEIEQLKEAK